MPSRLLPQSRFVRGYLLVMSVLILATILTGVAMLSTRNVQSETGPTPDSPGREPLPVLGTIDGFTLTDQAGRPFSTDALEGYAYVADFIFTSCPGVCPTMTGAMARLHEHFADDARVRFVSVTVDPETDTPEVLSWYANQYDADPGRWHFLTGPAADIQAIARDQFLVGSGDEPINHSARFVLVDGQGRIRGYYHGTEPASVAALRQDLHDLLASG